MLQARGQDVARFAQSRREAIAGLLASIAGRAVRVDIQPPGVGEGTADRPAAARRRTAGSHEEIAEAMRLPLTRKIVELFDAEPVDVRRLDEPDRQDDPQNP